MKLVVASLFAASVAAAPNAPIALPTDYVAHRFYMTPTLVSGAHLRCYTDSGGGGAFLFDDHDLGLPHTAHDEHGEKFESVPWPDFRAEAAIPPSIEPPFLILMARDDAPKEEDCFLGQSWFAGRVWTFDYPAQKLWYRPASDLPAHDKAHEAPLTFKTRKGKRDNQFARIFVTIDGEQLPLLFDTGAMTALSPAALSALADGGPAVRATSFITERKFKRWHKRHPDWRVIWDAEVVHGTVPMIEVPTMTVGGYAVGPVWFTYRANQNFDSFMSDMMSGHVEGALGGSALRYLRVTVDYPHGLAIFEQP